MFVPGVLFVSWEGVQPVANNRNIKIIFANGENLSIVPFFTFVYVVTLMV
jgi:hypothetical protein